MKRMIIGALLIAAVSSSLMAQRGHRGMPIERMKESLELSDQQVQQLEAIQAEAREQMKVLREKELSDKEEMRAVMLEIRSASKEKMESILTDDQRQKMEEFQTARNERHKERRKERMEGRKERLEVRKERHKEARAYKQDNIRPVMLEQRVKLEDEISKKDKKKLASLREHFKAEKEIHMAKMKAMKQKGERPDREQMKALKEAKEKSKETAEIKALTEKYADEIQSLMDEIETERGKWKSDMQEIMQPREKRSDRHVKRHHHMHKGKRAEGISKEEKQERHQLRKNVRFLLMDPNATIDENGTVGQSSMITEMEVFPNPASNDATISFELEKATKTRIELRDESGNLVKTFSNQKYDSGKISSRLDMTDVQTGVYYIVVIAQNGSQQTSRIVINK